MWFHVWIWAGTFQGKKSLGTIFLEKWSDFHFIGAALLKTDWVTVLITYLFTVCFNILQYSTVFTLEQYYCPLTLPLPLL